MSFLLRTCSLVIIYSITLASLPLSASSPVTFGRDLNKAVRIPDLATPIRPTTSLAGLHIVELREMGFIFRATRIVVKRQTYKKPVRRIVKRDLTEDILYGRVKYVPTRAERKRRLERQQVDDAIQAAAVARHIASLQPAVVPPPSLARTPNDLLKVMASEPLSTTSVPFKTLTNAMVPITYFVRSDGGSSIRCNGLSDAADPGSGTGQPCALANPADAITLVVCTDTIKAKAGQTFDTSGGFSLPDKSCSAANPITITSTATLPDRRVTPSDASLMPRFRATSTNAIFTAATNSGGWVIDGLELTDNAGTANINTLIDFGSNNLGISDLVFTRNYVHQKETGSNYERSVVRAMIFNGTGLDYTRNHVDIIGYPYGSTEPHNSAAFISVNGGDFLMEDNYVNVWYVHFFLGGGDTAPQHTATLSSASTTSATFSSVAGLEVGAFVRFSVVGTATLSNQGLTPTITRNTGAAWVAADGNQNGNWGDSVLLTSQADSSKTGIARLMSLTGDNVFTTTAANTIIETIPNGAVDYTIYQTARVTAIDGNVVTYDPQGTVNGNDYNTNALNKTPSAAAWNQGDEGRIVDVIVRKNTLNTDATFAAHLQGIGRGCPKGIFEVKNVDRFTFVGNRATGYPAVGAFTTANQNGSAPWITVNNVLIESNWLNPDTGYTYCSRSAFLISDDAYLNTITPTTSVTVTNNLITGGVRSLAHIKTGGTWTFTHNTIVNTQSSDTESAILLTPSETLIPNFVFTDNIGSNVCYGLQFYPASYVSKTISKNVLVDTDAGCSGGIATNTYGTGSILSPVITSFSSVGFVNQAGNNFRLSGASSYKGAGTGGLDPGIDQDALELALGITSSVLVCTWSSGCVSQ